MNCSTTRQRINVWLVFGLPLDHHVPQTKQKHRCDRREGDRNTVGRGAVIRVSKAIFVETGNPQRLLANGPQEVGVFIGLLDPSKKKPGGFAGLRTN
jgi:hypothetical protein